MRIDGKKLGWMWKNINGRLVHVADPSRVRFKTYISHQQLQVLEDACADADTHISYLLENGFQNLLRDESFVFLKKNRLRDKVEFRTTCDREILEQVKAFARERKLNFTDVVQAAVDYVDMSEAKRKSWRHRIE